MSFRPPHQSQIQQEETQLEDAKKLHHLTPELKDVSQNGRVSPSRVLAGSEHPGCAPKDTWDNLGVLAKGQGVYMHEEKCAYWNMGMDSRRIQGIFWDDRLGIGLDCG